MTKILLENILQFVIVLPIILLTFKKWNIEALKILLAFIVFFVLNHLLLYLPLVYSETRFVNGNWNWTGKLYSILGAIAFLSIYRKFPLKDYFLTIKQKGKFWRNGLLIIGIVLLYNIVSSYLGSKENQNLETLLFQFTMPGINEEIAFRGIMLGLLLKILKNRIMVFKMPLINPPILVTSILFGLAHGFSLSKYHEIVFNIEPFLRTMIYGIIWAWITIKSGSILLAILSHNLGNGVGKLISMR